MIHDKPIPNTAELILELTDELRTALCDHQAFFVIVFDEHGGIAPVGEDLLKRPVEERKRASDLLRTWAARVENGISPTRGES